MIEARAKDVLESENNGDKDNQSLAYEGTGDLQDDIVLQAAAGASDMEDERAIEWLHGQPTGAANDDTFDATSAAENTKDGPEALEDAFRARSYERRGGMLGVLDAQFERLAEEYDDDKIGELDEEVVDATNAPEHNLLSRAYEDLEERVRHKPDLQSLAPEGFRVLDPEAKHSGGKDGLVGGQGLEESKRRARELAERLDEEDATVDPNEAAEYVSHALM